MRAGLDLVELQHSLFRFLYTRPRQGQLDPADRSGGELADRAAELVVALVRRTDPSFEPTRERHDPVAALVQAGAAVLVAADKPGAR